MAQPSASRALRANDGAGRVAVIAPSIACRSADKCPAGSVPSGEGLARQESPPQATAQRRTGLDMLMMSCGGGTANVIVFQPMELLCT